MRGQKRLQKELKNIFMTLVAAMISVVALHTFVVPSDFSPSGVDGLCTVLYEIVGWNMGWFKILINIPLLILAFVFLNKTYVFYVMGFTLLDSVGVILLEKMNFYTYIQEGAVGDAVVGYRLLAALVSGIMLGICVGIMLKMGYSSGGVDIIAGLVNKWNPHIKIERIISILAYSIVGLSFFVYRDLTSVILSVIQIFVSEWTISALLKRERFALEVKIVTKEPDPIRELILYKYKHSATVAKTTGLYSGEDSFMIFSVMNLREIPSIMNDLKQYPDAFVYFSDGVRVQGDYHFKDEEIGGWISAFK